MPGQTTQAIELEGFVEQDTALESMRASDFDCYAAYGEVIDNSIQAEANDIRMEFQEKRVGNKKLIERVLFADNGNGMDANLLHKCLKLGHSSRYNSRSGIGRFGVGMTLGAIHECRRIEVYSMVAGGTWLYTYLDLDEIKQGTLKYLPPPKPKKPGDSIASYIKEKGTLIIWTKYDRQVEKYETIIEETRFWLGRTFRKFIWGTAKGYSEKVTISLNGTKVNAFDPLFVTKTGTGFENDPQAELFTPQVILWDIPKDAEVERQKEAIVLNVSLLPEELRRVKGQGGDQFAKDRFIHRNEGISIMRNDREVFYGHIPHTTKLAPKEADPYVNRYIGCEISFDAVHDEEFAIKNIKRGMVPERELKVEIVRRLAPTFSTCRARIRDDWSKREREDNSTATAENETFGISGQHVDVNKFLKTAKDTLLKNNKVNNVGDDEKIARKIKPEGTADEIESVIKGLRDNGITIDEREFIGDVFIDIEHGNGLKTLLYNTNSTCFKAYRDILTELSAENQTLAANYRVLMDVIFVSYMLAEAQIDPSERMEGSAFTSELKQLWALNLAKILKKWNSSN